MGEQSKCLCDGANYDLQEWPFIVHSKCPIHSQAMTIPTNSDRLREIAERAEKATAGPWEPYFTTHGDPYVAQKGRPKWGTVVSTTPDDYGRADCRFIAAAREDVPFLLSELDKLNAEKTYLETLAEGLTDGVNRATELIVALRAEKAETIEVLRAFPEEVDNERGAEGLAWYNGSVLPLLDKLEGKS